MTNGNVKTENGKLIAHPLAAHLYRPLRPSGTSPNLEEESGCEPTFMFQSFKFHVSIHFVPLSQGDEEQSSGGGMTIGKRKCENGKLIAHPLAAHLYRPLRPSGTLSEPRR